MKPSTQRFALHTHAELAKLSRTERFRITYASRVIRLAALYQASAQSTTKTAK